MSKPKDRKILVEEGIKLSIFVLRKGGALKHLFTSTYTWKNQSSAQFLVSIVGKSGCIELCYTFKPYLNFYFKVKLTKTSCHLGNYRWWFRCPNERGNRICNERVAMLYLPPGKEVFACRHCHNLTYESRNFSGIDKVGRLISFPALDREEEAIKRKFYRGVLTKRYKRFLDKDRKNLERIRKRQAVFKQRLSME